MARSEPYFDSGQRDVSNANYGSGGDRLYCEECDQHFDYVCGCHPDGPN